MRVAAFIACLALVLGACSSTPTAEDVSPTAPKPEAPKFDTARPEGVVKELYTSYFTVLNNGGESQAGNYVDKYFAPELASKYAAASNSPNNPINFDIFINAQDHRELTLDSLKRIYESVDHSTYEVHFTNNGDEQRVRIVMLKIGGTWKITDIEYAKSLTLSGMLK